MMNKYRDKIIGIALVSPSIIAVFVFIYGFIFWSFRVSLSQWKGLLPNYDWAGFQNYISLFSDPRFQIDIRNTLIFTALFVVGCLVLGLGMAVLLDRGIRGEAFFRTIFLFPMAISYIVTGVVWRWLMNPATGDRISGINLIFDTLGLDFLISRWFTTPQWGIAFIAIPAIWQMSGYIMALYLSALRAIPEEIREAAAVDGASESQIFWMIVFPLIQPITLSAVIILGHMSLKVFDLIVAIAGKQIALDVPAINMWQTTFDGLNYARGAAIGILLLISVAVLIIPYLRFSLKTEEQL